MNRWLVHFRLKNRIGWPDLVVTVLIAGVLYAILDLGKGMVVPFSPSDEPVIHLNPEYLPYYVGSSLLRMFIAYFMSLAFSLSYGRLAAYNRAAGKILIPALDILQSVPVLGFLSITVTGFLTLFPHSLLGAECASIFAIFTSQAWNMTFSFYHSLTTLPRDLQEASAIYRLRPWARFLKLEVPFSMIGLVWNSMMSFGGSWFFLAASESITVLHENIQLPGIGSYMAKAIATGNLQALLYAIATMVAVIIAIDQFVWRPVVAWSQKYKLDLSDTGNAPTSWFLQLLRRSEWVKAVLHGLAAPFQAAVERGVLWMASRRRPTNRRPTFKWRRIAGWTAATAAAIGAAVAARYFVAAVENVAALGLEQILYVLKLGFLTFLRVAAGTVLGALWTVPVGVAIGLSNRLSRIAQPIVQIAASFPSNMAFPLVTLLYMQWHVNFQLGAVPLMMLGTQWYILFNVIAGTMAIPSGLREAASILHLRSLTRWKTLILPAIFPYLVTGGITATGGAWNASIVAEIVTWKTHRLVATGLGSYIALATTNGDWTDITLGISTMVLFVVAANRLIWRPLYRLAETKYHLD